MINWSIYCNLQNIEPTHQKSRKIKSVTNKAIEKSYIDSSFDYMKLYNFH